MIVSLLLIDMQNDFCSPKGSLFVPGAVQDCLKVATFIKNNVSQISSIQVAMDTHKNFHIAHQNYWRDKDGNHPQPYTTITCKDLQKRKFVPYNDSLMKKTEEYLLALENRGRYRLTIWPQHCLLGTWGHCIEQSVFDAINIWENSYKKNSEFILKSSNQCTEHYSAIQAEVPDPEDASTRTNFALIDKLKFSDKIIVAGEALSHCVSNTLRDLCVYIPANRITVLTDCTSNVSGYQDLGDKFIKEYTEKGMNFTTSEDFSFK